MLSAEMLSSLGGAGAASGGGGGASSMLSGLGGGGGGGGQSGQAIGAGISLATSLVQGIQAAKLKRKADSAMPEMVDPNQAAFLSELNQKRKSIETGADFAGAMDQIDATTAGTNEAITRNTGGDVGGTIQALLQSAGSANNAKNNVIAQGQQQQMAYNNMYGGLLNQIAARRMQLQMYNSQQARGEWAKKQQAANQNFQAGITNAASALGQGQSGPGGQQMPGGEAAGGAPENLPMKTMSLPGGSGGEELMGGGNLDPSALSGLMGL